MGKIDIFSLNNNDKISFLEDAYSIALQRLNSSDKESPISLAYFGIFDGHGGKEAAEFARQHLCQHILEQDDFWTNSSDENQNDQSILSAIRKGFLSCHNDMWNHVRNCDIKTEEMILKSPNARDTAKNGICSYSIVVRICSCR